MRSLIYLALPRLPFVVAYALALILSTSATAIPVIPGAVGFGMATVAGRGGAVMTVTSLANSGPGTLREALEASGPRTVIFAKSGNINLTRSIVITSPFITIAGQTAPSPGIQVTGAAIVIRTHDVLIQHIRVRPGGARGGPNPRTRDAISISATRSTDTYNVVLDHVSLAWSVDGLLDTFAPRGRWVREVTIRNSILAEALHCPPPADSGTCLHPKGDHSRANLIGNGAKNVTVWRNVYVRNQGRNPMLIARVTGVAVVNNVVYKPGPFNTSRIDVNNASGTETAYATIEGNVVITRDADTNHKAVLVRGTGPTQLYLANNTVVVPNPPGTETIYSPLDPWDTASKGVLGLQDGHTVANTKVASRPTGSWPGRLPVLTRNIESIVLASAGARPADRDADDARIINDVKERTGPDFYDMPPFDGPQTLAENSAADTLPADPSGDSDGDGYTNLEEWLHSKAAVVEAGLRLPLAVRPRGFTPAR